mmetsp:Transcript_48001/g.148290  ORF Transcript_48001/g.148290 Transcript_48001/m.148290 type:complete len:265 (-) Transcript_48001:454-1248(-)
MPAVAAGRRRPLTRCSRHPAPRRCRRWLAATRQAGSRRRPQWEPGSSISQEDRRTCHMHGRRPQLPEARSAQQPERKGRCTVEGCRQPQSCCQPQDSSQRPRQGSRRPRPNGLRARGPAVKPRSHGPRPRRQGTRPGWRARRHGQRSRAHGPREGMHGPRPRRHGTAPGLRPRRHGPGSRAPCPTERRRGPRPRARGPKARRHGPRRTRMTRARCRVQAPPAGYECGRNAARPGTASRRRGRRGATAGGPSARGCPCPRSRTTG